VHQRATYGYRRVWARLKLKGFSQIDHKWVYRVIIDQKTTIYKPIFIAKKSLATVGENNKKYQLNKVQKT